MDYFCFLFRFSIRPRRKVEEDYKSLDKTMTAKALMQKKKNGYEICMIVNRLFDSI